MPEKESAEEIEKRILDTVSYLRQQGITPKEIIELISKTLKIPEKEISVPISAFDNNYLGSLETIVKYLRENKFLSFKQIAALTARNEIALAVTYRSARRKLEAKFADEACAYYIPVSILQDRRLSVLENVVSYLKDNFALTYHKIGVLLNRNDRTIWTVYQRSRKKGK